MRIQVIFIPVSASSSFLQCFNKMEDLEINNVITMFCNSVLRMQFTFYMEGKLSYR